MSQAQGNQPESSSAAASRTYDDAIGALNSLQSNAATIEALRKSGGRLLDFAIPEMVEYLERIGYNTSNLDRLNVIHITGTKGKGSTSAFVDSLLRQLTPVQASSPPKVGLYTSPHMTSVRERIRINGQPVSHELFTKYFWQVWDRLEENPTRKFDLTPLRPVYFRFLTLLAFHIFLSEGVQPVILEVGIGGKYDSTNIVPKCVVAGITQLGLDHTAVLGNTVEEIAVQKAGIFKPQAPAVCWAQQPGKALDEVKRIAREVDVSDLTIVDIHPGLLRSEATALGTEDAKTVSLGLPGVHQRTNASVALELVNAYLESEAGRAMFKDSASRADALADWQKKGLEDARWPGRCQTVPTARKYLGLTWYLDGAHTTDSLSVCLGWFTAIQQKHAAEKRNKRIFVFNCTNGRSAHELLSAVLDAVEKGLGGDSAPTLDGSKYALAKDYFDEAIFTTNITFEGGGWSSELTSKLLDDSDLVNLTVQKQLAETWKELVPGSSTEVKITPSIQAMHNHVVKIGGEQVKAGAGVDCLVSGSLHLVGGVMAHLQQSGCLDDSLVSTVRP
ncbi:related to tetrahydrofolylpolyglutamate synthase (met6+) [Ustilago bromivora]|uniref:Folylpolyglutamate synthase n=1 Tax=Ustilago bromivora TaxID=307758 RepID=A0A1K0GV20_9BASI|nr:related to tetrahydrofolylpolyglutamate synthase (met6+) [Ustilago bromivora]SYW80638.1 related to tetrahydrofolylpolyglutamate synthase (met6+) [Ustilago bromivora]